MNYCEAHLAEGVEVPVYEPTDTELREMIKRINPYNLKLPTLEEQRERVISLKALQALLARLPINQPHGARAETTRG